MFITLLLRFLRFFFTRPRTPMHVVICILFIAFRLANCFVTAALLVVAQRFHHLFPASRNWDENAPTPLFPHLNEARRTHAYLEP